MGDGSRGSCRGDQTRGPRAVELRPWSLSFRASDTRDSTRGCRGRSDLSRKPAEQSRRRSTTHFAGFLASHSKGRFLTYLMWRRDRGFRVGLSAGAYSIGRNDNRFGPAHRGLVERADAVWVISAHDREIDARLAEATLAAKYGLPTMPFVAVAGSRSETSIVASQRHINQLFAACETETRGRRLLEQERLEFELPHYQPQARTMLARHGETRHVVNVALCAARSGATVLHRVAVQGSDEDGRRSLEQLGLNVRSLPGGTSRWGFETMRRNYSEVLALAEMIASRLGCVLRQVAAIGDPRAPGRHATSLPFVPARLVRPGMVMATEHGELERVEAVEFVSNDMSVYDLNVEATHNFLANGIVTHNCIYSWRGAQDATLSRSASGSPRMRGSCWAATSARASEILEPAARCIAHNEQRLAKALIATRGAGGQARVSRVRVETATRPTASPRRSRRRSPRASPRARFSCSPAPGTPRGRCRRALARAGIPHRVLGSLGLYERSEVRDALAYLTLLPNPADAQAFRRAIGSPRRGVGTATATKSSRCARDTTRRPDRRERARRRRSRHPAARRARPARRFGDGLDTSATSCAPGGRSVTSSSPP